MKAFLSTTRDLNAESNLIHVKNLGYNISSFEGWRGMREAGWIQQSWLLFLLYSANGASSCRMIAFFKRHKRLACDAIGFPECIALYFTGAERKSDGTEAKSSHTYYEDEYIPLREKVIYEESISFTRNLLPTLMLFK